MALNFSRHLLGQDSKDPNLDKATIKKIMQLSYEGDIRMDFKAESSDKIDRILEGNFQEIFETYQKISETNSQRFPDQFSLSKLRAINKASSAKMALSQFFLNSQGKNVSSFREFC